MKNLFRLAVTVISFGALLLGCSGGVKKLAGAGATFPDPLYKKMFLEYNTKTGLQVNYEAIGSGGGIKNLSDKIVDFGGTDSPMSDKDIQAAGANILHIPTCLGAVVVTYSLPGNPDLKMDGALIADIFLGKVAKWNDKRIADLNPGVTLPDLAITVVYRSDGSGTTFAYTDYLTRVSAEWKEKVGCSKSVNWPVGGGQKGNPGVAGFVKQNEGSIGYVEMSYAKQNGMKYATVKNKAGNFILPTLESISAAANANIPDDTRVSIADTDAVDGYPISSFTWVIIYQEQKYNERSIEQAKALVELIWWMTHEGQKYAGALDYGQIPAAVVGKVENILNSVVYNGQKVRQ